MYEVENINKERNCKKDHRNSWAEKYNNWNDISLEFKSRFEKTEDWLGKLEDKII